VETPNQGEQHQDVEWLIEALDLFRTVEVITVCQRATFEENDAQLNAAIRIFEGLSQADIDQVSSTACLSGIKFLRMDKN